MRVFLFGNVRVEIDGVMVPVGGSAGALLGYLGLMERPMRRSKVAGVLFGDVLEEQARRRLTHVLYRLRQVIGDGHLEADGEWIGLRDVVVDVARFRSVGAALGEKQAAIDLYGGDLLEEVDAEWVLGDRMLLRERFLTLLGEVVAALMGAGRFGDALLLANRWVLSDPLDESAHGRLIEIYARLGRYGAALKQFERLEQFLEEELGVQPLSETVELVEGVRRERRGEGRGQKDGDTAVFFGRVEERGRILDVVERGRGVVFLEGVAGIGKSALLDEVARAAEWRGCLVGRGVAAEGSVQVFAPFAEAVWSLLSGRRYEIAEREMSRLGWRLLSGMVPQVGARSRFGVGESVMATVGTLDLAVQELFEVLGSEGSIVLLLDDVQWAGDGLWRLLSVLVRLPVVVVLAFRLGEIRENVRGWEVLQEVDRLTRVERVLLGKIDFASAVQLARRVEAGISAETIQLLYDRAAGNPFVLRQMLEGGEDKIESLIAGRVGRLGREARLAVEAVCVLEGGFSLELWQGLVDFAVPVEELVAAEFVVEDRVGFRFQHDLVRAFLIGNLSLAGRQEAHKRVASLPAQSLAAAGTRGRHWEAAGDLERAADLYRREAENALESGLAREGRLWTERALGLGGDGLRLRLLRLRCEQLEGWTGGHAEQIEALAAAAEAIGDEEAVVLAGLARLKYLTAMAELDALVAAIERVVGDARRYGDRELLAFVLINSGYRLASERRDVVAARPLVVEAIGLGVADEVTLQGWLALVYVEFTDRRLAEARTALVEAERLFVAAGEPAQFEVALWTQQAFVAQLAVDIERARELQNRLAAFYRRHGDHGNLVRALWMSAHLAKNLGQHEEAVLYGEELVRLASAAGQNDLLRQGQARLMLGDCYLMAGDVDSAEEVLGVMVPILESADSGHLASYGWSMIGFLRFCQGRFEEAVAAYEEVIALATQRASVTSSPFSMHAEAAVFAGQLEAARVSVARAEQEVALETGSSNVPYFYYVRYLVERDAVDLARARFLMFERVTRIRSAQFRRDLLLRMPVNVDMERAWAQVECETVMVVLVKMGVGFGRKPTPSDLVSVPLTPDDGLFDAQTKKKTQRRRNRIIRLSGEATLHGAVITQQVLADLLSVSVRTIERDVAALAESGILILTRRSM